MILHSELGATAFQRSRTLKNLLNDGAIHFAGNKNLKIYGTLSCSSGKRMSLQNRIFFASSAEATSHGYRPCGHCMRDAYKKWKGDLH